jgi:hypothetical protein
MKSKKNVISGFLVDFVEIEGNLMEIFLIFLEKVCNAILSVHREILIAYVSTILHLFLVIFYNSLNQGRPTQIEL